ncbi:PREDICTED: uncharacterized protein LOC105141831 isoform X2 [Populus euphratica]|uniref:Uncharacterized protein LOC105141831 isoform X2 n=1 Tax=Populus euphratica TaxID=75702 RepID=A0AAJ6VGS0_POPEU|nr:PREDICTED: uncharacterized protein LOC105141831 isoform X2 [Populus euphratica]
MVRFSCFSARIHSHKSKKTAQPSDEARHKSLEDLSQIQALPLTKSSSLMLPKAQAGNQISNGVRDATRADVSVEQSWKSDKNENKMDDKNENRMDDKNDMGAHQTRLIRKSQSLGSGLCHEGRVLCDNDTEEIDQRVYSDSLDQNGLLRPDGSKDSGISTTSEHEKALQLGSFHGSYGFVKECIFSIDNRHYSEKEGPENSDTPFSGDGGNLSGNQSPHSPLMIEKSCSFSDMGPYALTSHRHSYEYLAPQSRSSEDLHALGMRLTTISIQGGETQKMKEQGRDDNMPNTEENNNGSCIDEGFEFYNYSALAENWIMPVMDEVNLANDLQEESPIQQWEELPSKDFKMKRIKDWVNNLQHFGPLEETNGLPGTDDPVKGDSNDLTSAKVDNKDTPSIEAAKRYISSLSVSATTAHLSNHELAVIPFLGVFGSLRMLNLSGNSIVRITAGALPRGLHMLNLSRNNISSIEGLRELTRLRVLDLSYNRIFRIGHGLASCSSLKELYLAGNKISEVEGLHRLLKLSVLDLRFNKISTTKCLGQLAANYSSLQAISLEGNSAQKNVGDEQLKKYLQGLLPHLIYFNRQSIKTSTLKDTADRSVRLGISSHQFDRGLRSDNKAVRKASHGLGGARPLPSSTHARKSQPVISTKRSSGRHLRSQPSGTQATTSLRHHDLGSKLLNFRSESSLVHRSRSEGTLGAF